MGGRWSQLLVVTGTAFASGVYAFDPLIRRDAKKLELEKLQEEEPTVTDEDPRVIKLNQDITRLGEVAEAESLWALWRHQWTQRRNEAKELAQIQQLQLEQQQNTDTQRKEE